ncbi:hypothetical protein [Bradyrhizobium sp.]|uniref:hypothetical protein n=1 Tax=Bradyrhizobium sp. TaxID=376 RepID=UPI00345BD795
MSAGLHRIDLPGFTRLACQWSPKTLFHFRPGLLLLAATLAAGVAMWLVLRPLKGEIAASEPAHFGVAAVQRPSAHEAPPAGAGGAAVQPDPGAIGGLRISSQSWRRGDSDPERW